MADTPRIARRRADLGAAARRGLTVAAILTLAGGRAEAGPFARLFGGGETAYADGAPKPADNQTPSLMSRWLTRDRTPHASEVNGSSVRLGKDGWESTQVAANPAADAELDAAMKLFDAGKHAEALPLFTKIANREGKKGTSPWGQKALFHVGECQFLLGRYVDANNSFETLVKKNPGLEPAYLDRVVAREYEIAQIWLASEDPKAKPLPFQARFTGQMPLADVNSHAVKILEQVRLHDRKGPLADAAVLRMADHYHTVGDYESAALYYDELVADHPKSEYRERAMRSSIDAKMKGYIGPEYDSTGLDSAREMVKQTMTNFPETQDGADGLYHTLDLINEQEAERNYEIGKYYVRALKPTSAEYQFGMVMAKVAQEQVGRPGQEGDGQPGQGPAQGQPASKIMTLPGQHRPPHRGASSGAGAGMGGVGSAGAMSGSPY
jgi:outer membrane protein assembly factor BamD (BamD/ComL family)